VWIFFFSKATRLPSSTTVRLVSRPFLVFREERKKKVNKRTEIRAKKVIMVEDERDSLDGIDVSHRGVDIETVEKKEEVTISR
jgi:hypothetical protein